MEHGLRSAGWLGQQHLPFAHNDHKRLDGYRGATSLSIAHPNDRLFYRWRMEQPDRKWVVLKLDPAILWQHTVRFCACNAADSRARKDAFAGSGVADFERMFTEPENLPTRASQLLNIYDPTDIQAEVLCFAPIMPDQINSIVFNDEETMKCWSGKLSKPSTVGVLLGGSGTRTITCQKEGEGYFGSRSAARRAARVLA